jgi:hypothetical protein
MNVALNGLPKSWEPFVKGVCAQENLQNWQWLWDDCIQEETWEESKEDKQEDEEEENLFFFSKTRKCHKYGNYASKCMNKKRVQSQSQ